MSCKHRHTQSGTSQSLDCTSARDLTEYELSQQLSRAKASKDVLTPFYIHPLLASHMSKSDLHPESLKHYKSFNYTVFGDRNCPKEIKSGTKTLMDNSLCPWYIDIDFDKYRYPRILLKAKCRCEQCVGTEKSRSATIETVCKQVTIKEKVLRQKLSPGHGTPICKEGKAVYESVWEEIPIACACALNIAETEE